MYLMCVHTNVSFCYVKRHIYLTIYIVYNHTKNEKTILFLDQKWGRTIICPWYMNPISPPFPLGMSRSDAGFTFNGLVSFEHKKHLQSFTYFENFKRAQFWSSQNLIGQTFFLIFHGCFCIFLRNFRTILDEKT